MAYCVHCGVKLGEAEKKCPLCGTEAIDPSAPKDQEAPRKPFPVRTLEQTLMVNRRYTITLLALLLLLPAAACIVIDLLSGGISWSVYPAGVLVLIWITVAVPLLLKRHRLYSTILISGATLGGYLFLVELVSGATGWFLPIVLPALALFIAMVCLMAWLVRSKRLRILRLMALGFLEIGILCIVVELLCVNAGVAGSSLQWSPYVIVPCVFVALVLYVISRSGPLSTELKRRFHF